MSRVKVLAGFRVAPQADNMSRKSGFSNRFLLAHPSRISCHIIPRLSAGVVVNKSGSAPCSESLRIRIVQFLRSIRSIYSVH
jgi:hypothetical protein